MNIEYAINLSNGIAVGMSTCLRVFVGMKFKRKYDVNAFFIHVIYKNTTANIKSNL